MGELTIRFSGESHYAGVYHGLHRLWNKSAPNLPWVLRELSQANSVLVLVVLEPFEFGRKCCTLVERILRKAPRENPSAMESGSMFDRDFRGMR
jgi:hypothetical protein